MCPADLIPKRLVLVEHDLHLHLQPSLKSFLFYAWLCPEVCPEAVRELWLSCRDVLMFERLRS